MSSAAPTTMIGSGGWVRLTLPELTAPVYVRFQPSSAGGRELARLEPYDVCVTPEGPLPLDALRQIPLDRLTLWANSPEALPEILEAIGDTAPDVATSLKFFKWDVHTYLESLAEGEELHYIARERLAQLGEEPMPVAPQDEAGPTHQRRRLAQGGKRRKLKIPDSRPYPDEFFRQLAELYMDLAWRSSTPAKDLAEAHGVKVTTVHGWVAKARKRGFLAQSPGQGRVG